ncbi:MAG: DUF4339 domain-containing protein, partial [Planctomycetaceae bacterium]|nr:DUF4339 domain-containing protein [Planctomycetaceae bacterium]
MVNPKQFFYQVDDAIIGPVTGIDLREAALAGSVVPATLVASDPSGQWVAANRVRGLFDESGKALPHPDEVKQSVANKEVVGIQPASTTPERGLSRSDDSSDEFRESAQPGDARNEPSAQDSARISPELWYAFLAGQIIGPLTVEQIRIMTRDGKLLPSDHVAVAGGQEWIQARHVEGLAFAATILTTGQPIPPPVQIEPRPSVECLGAPEIVPVVASHGSDIEASHVEQIRHTSALLSP